MFGKKQPRPIVDDYLLGRDALDAVASGSTTRLDLHLLMRRESRLTEVPDEVRTLDNLTDLTISDEVERLPDWLSDLPRLKHIDTFASRLATIPMLPGVRWSLNAETLHSVGDGVDPSSVVGIRIDSRTSAPALRYVQRLSETQTIKLEEVQVHASLPSLTKHVVIPQWENQRLVESTLDVVLRSDTGVERVFLWGCPLSHLPTALSGLPKLWFLRAGAVKVHPIPDWLFLIPELRELRLERSGLVDLPASVGEARQLTTLDLSYNDFAQIPAGIWNLTGLETLSMEGCPITEVPREVLRLEKLTTLTLGEHQLGTEVDLPPEFLSPPPEIASQGLGAIKNFWRQQSEAGVDYLAEAKLLIVGEPGAGKTTLAKKLLDPAYVLDSAEDSTEGIDVSTWEFPSAIRAGDGR
jgi:internalin A